MSSLQSSPTKKSLTEDTRASLVATNQPPNTYIDEELRLRLQNRPSRVRKSVMEGYSTNRNIGVINPIKVDASTESPVLAPLIFRSARDTNQDIFTPGTIPPFPSPRKRGRVEYEDQVESFDEVNGDVDVEMHHTDPLSPNFEDAAKSSSRSIKPLRQARRLITVDPFRTSSTVPNLPTPRVDSVSTYEDPFID